MSCSFSSTLHPPLSPTTSPHPPPLVTSDFCCFLLKGKKSPSSAFHFDEALFLAVVFIFLTFISASAAFQMFKKASEEGRKLQPDEIVEEEPQLWIERPGRQGNKSREEIFGTEIVKVPPGIFTSAKHQRCRFERKLSSNMSDIECAACFFFTCSITGREGKTWQKRKICFMNKNQTISTTDQFSVEVLIKNLCIS